MLRRIAVVCFVLGFVLHGRAQEQEVYINGSDTLHYTYTPLPGQEEEPQAEKRPPFLRRVVKYFEGSTTDRTFEKKIDFTFAGGPSYSKNTSLGIGLLAAGLYRIDRTDSVTAPSDISIFANVSISGFYALGVTGNNIFARNSKRIDYTVMFASAPRDMWGIGYHDGRYNEEGSYNEKRYLVKGRYLHRVLPSTYVGGILSFEHTQGKKFDARSEGYLQEYGQKTHYTATGIGAILEYDSRDFIPNPYRGIYVSLEETFYAKGLGNCGKSLWRTTFTADWYRQVWKGGLIATDLYAEFNSEGTPWPMLARMGGSQRMRGYYTGALYGQRHDYLPGRVAPAHLAAYRLHGMGRCRQRIQQSRPVRLVGNASQLWRRPAMGAEKTGQCAARLRLRQENQRIPAEPERSFLG